MLRQGISSTAAAASGAPLMQQPSASGPAQASVTGATSEAILSPEEDRKRVEVRLQRCLLCAVSAV